MREQRLRHVIPVTQPLLLSSQIQRSGGTLFTRLFDGHPSCLVHPAELRWGHGEWPDLSAAGQSIDELFAEVAENWPAKFARNGYRKQSKALDGRTEAAESLPFLFDVDLQRQVFAAQVERGGGTRREVLNAYLTSLFNAWLDCQSLYSEPKQWVVAFEPRFIRKRLAPRFFDDYPDGLLVTIVREPAAWLASYARHTGYDVAKCLRQWHDSLTAGLQIQEAYPDRVVVLLFEDLVNRTEATMRGLCERMGIAFSDVLTRPTYNSMPVLSDSSYQPVYGIDRAVTERYQSALPPDILARVETEARPLYEEVRARYALPPA